MIQLGYQAAQELKPQSLLVHRNMDAVAGRTVQATYMKIKISYLRPALAQGDYKRAEAQHDSTCSCYEDGQSIC